ncbi:MAG: FkbM family methyltransferase [Alphaproteobacteria bacterium]
MTDANTLEHAVAELGQNEALRNRLVEVLRDAEPDFARPDFEVREHVTGPVVDALFSQVDVLRKKLKNGLVFEFVYRSKIARDFVMSTKEAPDHVWEPQTTKLLVHLCQEAGNVAVGGAYFGDQAVFMAKAMEKKGGRCHCFEPNPEQSRMLARNTEINGLGNVVINQAALWSVNDVRIALMGSDSHAYPQVIMSDTEAAGRETFPAVTLDAYGREKGVEAFDLIMLDIEGGEMEALRGAESYLDQPKGEAPNLVFEIHRSYVDWSDGLENTDIVSFLTAKGYHVYSVRDYQSNVPMADQPIELIPPSETYLEGPPHGFNMLAVKDVGVTRDNIFRMRSGVSPKLLAHRNPKLHQPIKDD